MLGLIQGLTEFLPISSSAHLILPNQLLGWPDQGLAFDIAVHVGTLSAVLVYYWKDLMGILKGWFPTLRGDFSDENGRLGWYIILSTIPVGIVGLAFGGMIEDKLRSVVVIAATTIIFGIVLGIADLRGRGTKDVTAMTVTSALIIGCFQAIALIPGVSRSGITMTAGLFLGFNRTASARFSFLLSIPTIIMSAVYKGKDLIHMSEFDWMPLAIGVAVSGVSAYFCIYYFMGFLNRIGMMPYVYYRLLLGLVLVGVIAFF